MSTLSSSNGDSSNGGMTLHVRMSTGARFTIPGPGSSLTITTSTTLQQVKQCIAEHDGSDRCPAERQRLIFRGRILAENTKTLAEYGITENDAVLHLVKGSAPPSAPGGGGAAGATAVATPTSSATTPGTSTSTVGAFPPNLFDPNAMMNPMQNNPMMQQMMNNPEFMQSILNSPMFQNPDVLMNLMQANPQMRQLMDANPQLRHVLSDPQILQQTMQAMRDPSHMATMMRNQDLAMSQIENYPGGFNALRRMYEEVQEPMMEAMSGGAGAGDGTSPSEQGGSGTSSSPAGVGNRGGIGAMPNPWGSGSTPSSTGRSGTGGTAPIVNPWAAPRTTPSTTGSRGDSNIMPDMSALLNAMGGAGSTSPTGHPSPEFMEQTLALMDNPQIHDMMNNMLSNPQMMQQIWDMNPQLRALRDSNPGVGQMMSNPEFMRTMMDPNVLRAMMNLQQALDHSGARLPGGSGFGGAGMGGLTGAGGVPGGLDFSSLLQQTQNMGISSSGRPHVSTTAQRYDHLVTQLVEMGFDDRDANLRALQASGGNINRAVDWLLENPSPPSQPSPDGGTDAAGGSQ